MLEAPLRDRVWTLPSQQQLQAAAKQTARTPLPPPPTRPTGSAACSAGAVGAGASGGSGVVQQAGNGPSTFGGEWNATHAQLGACLYLGKEACSWPSPLEIYFIASTPLFPMDWPVDNTLARAHAADVEGGFIS